jgi:DNA-binding transcriptional LysR family regulator
VTPSAVSQAIRALEARIGLPLFQRTTRKVALTDAGAALLSQLSPAASSINDALENLAASKGRPAGNLRLSVPRIALELVMWDVVPAFRQAYPEITLELDVNDASVDLAAGQFDAGIRMGEYIERDLVAVRVTDDLRRVVVASPRYLKAHGRPSSPKDLTDHECIRYRFPTARTVYRWEFTKASKTYSVEPRGGVTVNDHLSMIELAGRGAGLAYTFDLLVARAVSERRLEEVLAQHMPKASGLFLYFPAKSDAQPKLRAFIDFAKERMRKKRGDR